VFVRLRGLYIGAEIYKISETLSVISLGLFIAAGYAFSISFDEMKLHCTVGR
jgi:hypothetical protein